MTFQADLDIAQKKKNRKKRPSPVKGLLPLIGLLAVVVIISGVVVTLMQQENQPEFSATLTPVASQNIMITNEARLTRVAQTPGGSGVVGMSPTQQPQPSFTPAALTSDIDRTLLYAANSRTTLLNSFQFDVNATFDLTVGTERGILTLIGTGNLTGFNDPESVGMQVNLEGNVQLYGQQVAFTVEVRWVEDSLYFYVTSPTTGTQTKWLVMRINDILQSATIIGPNGDLIVPNVTDLDPEQFSGMEEILELFDFGRFIEVTRKPDTETSTTYVFDVDLLSFLKSEDFISLIGVGAEFSGVPLPEEQRQQLSSLLRLIVPGLLPQLNLVFEQTIDRREQVSTGFRVDFDTIVDLAALYGILDPSAEAPPPITFKADIVVNLSNHGTTFTVVAPPDAIEIQPNGTLPPDAILPLTP